MMNHTWGKKANLIGKKQISMGRVKGRVQARVQAWVQAGVQAWVQARHVRHGF
jgi:hypothetical protein